MAKYEDTQSLGRSSEVPFIDGEDAAFRHFRRLKAAEGAEPLAKQWAKRHGVVLTVSNNGHHWQFWGNGKKKRAEWWPHTAKLVFDGKYRRGIHAHDWKQVVNEVARRWGIEGVK